MPRDFEDELRRSLHARAGDITPDPALFARVQSRISRARTFRLAFAGVAGALAIAAAAIAAPGMMERRVEFEPAPVAEQPPSEAMPTATETATPAAPAPVGTPPPFVFTDGGSVELAGEGSILAGTGNGNMQSVAARPGTNTKSITLAVAEGGDCAVVRYGVGGAQPAEVEEGVAPPPGTDVPVQDGCAATPVFSPDGESLAWVAATGDGWTIQTIDWTDEGPGENDASFGLPWPSDQPVDLQEWVWEEQTATTAKGHLVVRTQRQGAWMLLRIPIERQGDGSLGIVLDAAPLVSDEDEGVPVAFASAGDDVTYTMELEFAEDGPQEGSVVVWRRSGDEVDGGFAVPQELYSESDFDVADVWMTASPEAVLFGNAGTGKAWWIPFPKNAAGGLDEPPAMPQAVNGEIAWADLLVAPSAPAAGGVPTEDPGEPQATEVDVFFGMTGADACVADHPVRRQVEGPGVARAAVTYLLEGPTSRESNEGVVSPFSAYTAGTLNDITIVDGQARVDFMDFSAQVPTDSCTKSAIVDALDRTLLQFSTVTSTQYSFDGSTRAWKSWLGSDTEHPSPPPAPVQRTADRIRGAAQTEDWDALRRLSAETSCTSSDQPEPCVPHWKEQEANGEDPLGTLAALLEQPATKHPDAAMWVWPPEWAAGSGYTGARVGIDPDGVWRYYVQAGEG